MFPGSGAPLDTSSGSVQRASAPGVHEFDGEGVAPRVHAVDGNAHRRAERQGWGVVQGNDEQGFVQFDQQAAVLDADDLGIDGLPALAF